MASIKFTSSIKTLQRQLEAYDKKRIKAAQTAVKVEAFNQMKGLRKEIREGAPGDRKFHPLSAIAMARKTRSRAKNKTPLARMASAVFYKTEKQGNNTIFSVGFTKYHSWQYLAQKHQEGFSKPVTDPMRHALIFMGEKLKRSRIKTRNRAGNVFFLKKSTTSINVPARPIIDPYWEAHKREAEQNIIVNFHRKMRGERI